MPAHPEAAVPKDRVRGVVPGRTGDSATRVRSRPAQIESLERHPISGRADHRPGAEQLVEAHLAVKNVAADKAEPALQVQRRMDLPAQHRLGEARRMRIYGGDDLVGGLLPLIIPASSRPEVEAKMLAEERRDVLAFGSNGISISMIGFFAQPSTAASR